MDAPWRASIPHHAFAARPQLRSALPTDQWRSGLSIDAPPVHAVRRYTGDPKRWSVAPTIFVGGRRRATLSRPVGPFGLRLDRRPEAHSPAIWWHECRWSTACRSRAEGGFDVDVWRRALTLSVVDQSLNVLVNWRPGHRSASDEVNVEVADRVLGVWADVEDEAVAAGKNSFVFGDAAGEGEHRRNDGPSSGRTAVASSMCWRGTTSTCVARSVRGLGRRRRRRSRRRCRPGSSRRRSRRTDTRAQAAASPDSAPGVTAGSDRGARGCRGGCGRPR